MYFPIDKRTIQLNTATGSRNTLETVSQASLLPPLSACHGHVIFALVSEIGTKQPNPGAVQICTDFPSKVLLVRVHSHSCLWRSCSYECCSPSLDAKHWAPEELSHPTHPTWDHSQLLPMHWVLAHLRPELLQMGMLQNTASPKRCFAGSSMSCWTLILLAKGVVTTRAFDHREGEDSASRHGGDGLGLDLILEVFSNFNYSMTSSFLFQVKKMLLPYGCGLFLLQIAGNKQRERWLQEEQVTLLQLRCRTKSVLFQGILKQTQKRSQTAPKLSPSACNFQTTNQSFHFFQRSKEKGRELEKPFIEISAVPPHSHPQFCFLTS